MSLFTGAAIIGAALAAGGTSVAAAKISSNAASDAGDKASASNAAALEFNKQQAENEYKNQETTRKANYDQHVAQQTANNKIRQGLGLAPVEIPAYVPSVDPAFTGSTPPPAGQSVGTIAGAPPTPFGAQAAGGTPAPGTMTAPPPRPVAPNLAPGLVPLDGGMSLGAMAGAPIQVRARSGQIVTFPTQQAADAYKQQQGIV